MNLTKLERRIVRETGVTVDGTPLIISLEVGGQVGLKQKGTRHTLFVSLATLWATLTATEGKAAAVAASKKASKVKSEPVRVPSALEAAIQLIKESDKPIHIKTLEKLVSGEIAPENLRKMLQILKGEHILEQDSHFRVRAVHSERSLSSV